MSNVYTLYTCYTAGQLLYYLNGRVRYIVYKIINSVPTYYYNYIYKSSIETEK